MMLKVLLAALCFSAIQAATILHQDSPDRIPGEYIVVLNPVAGKRAANTQHIDITIAKVKALSEQFKVGSQWVIDDFLGFELFSDDELVASYVGNLPEVKFVEVNQKVYSTACTTQNSPIWNLGRISGKSNTNGAYAYEGSPNRAKTAVYILETGIRLTHNEFSSLEGRAKFGANFAGSSSGDRNGHGTHTAGTAVGTNYGVAKSIDVIDVKVLGESRSGSTTGVINGINWAAGRTDYSNGVLSLSLGGGASTSMDNAVDAAATRSVVVVAAGNSNANACFSGPARASGAITVGSTQQQGDQRSSFNYGTCVDIFAPGSSITCAWWTSNSATNTISGTSMACPHVAGMVAWYLSEVSGATVSDATAWLTRTATSGVVGIPSTGFPNTFLYGNCPLAS